MSRDPVVRLVLAIAVFDVTAVIAVVLSATLDLSAW